MLLKKFPEENPVKAAWIMELLNENKKPIIKSLKVFETRKEAELLETQLIRKYKSKHKLVNLIDDSGVFAYDKIVKILGKPTYVYHKDGTFYAKFKTMLESSYETGVIYSDVKRCIKGMYKYSKEWQFSSVYVDRMPDLSNYNRGALSVDIKDNETGNVVTYASIKDCLDKFSIKEKITHIPDLKPLLNKYYGNKYSMRYGDETEFTQSKYYNTGVIIVLNSGEVLKFKSKLEAGIYVNYKSVKGDKSFIKLMHTKIPNIKEIKLKQPLCLVINKDN